MGREFAKTMLKKSLRAMGLEIRRVAPSGGARTEKVFLLEMLEQLKEAEFYPATVIDVGAAYGAFARQCFSVFEKAEFFLVEPLVEYQPSLEQLAKTIPALRCLFLAASSQSREVTINVHPDLVGSSLYHEVEEGTSVNGFPRTVRAMTVDDLIKENMARGPFLLKVDVQGAELEVLRGAEGVLRHTECILLEVSFFRFFQDGPDFYDVLMYLKDRGFVVHDIYGLQYRPLDNALAQADIAFVKESGRFRQRHFYATPEQREEQNRRIQACLRQLFT